jgi:putative transposase
MYVADPADQNFFTWVLFLVLRQAQKEWKMPPREWSMAKAQFAILFEGRFRPV